MPPSPLGWKLHGTSQESTRCRQGSPVSPILFVIPEAFEEVEASGQGNVGKSVSDRWRLKSLDGPMSFPAAPLCRGEQCLPPQHHAHHYSHSRLVLLVDFEGEPACTCLFCSRVTHVSYFPAIKTGMHRLVLCLRYNNQRFSQFLSK
jgi:hypothetical protein